MLTREQAITEACKIVALAYHSIGNYEDASDGFCDECIARGMEFRNAGGALAYVRSAVVRQLKADGHEGFDAVIPLAPAMAIG